MSDIVKAEIDIKTKAIKVAQTNDSLRGLKPTQINHVMADMLIKIDDTYNEVSKSNEMVTILTTVFEKNPTLKECSLKSIFGAIQQTLNLKLLPEPTLNLVYYVPRNVSKLVDGKKVWNKEVQFQLGYQGYKELARRSGNIKSISADIIYEGDEYKIEYGTNRNIDHKPSFKNDHYDKILFVYGVAFYKDGSNEFIVLTKEDIEKRRLMSPMQKGKPTGIWDIHYSEMAKAKVTRALCKNLQLSVDVQKSMSFDECVISKSLDENNQDDFVKPEFELKQEEIEYDEDFKKLVEQEEEENYFNAMMKEKL